jgi:hypothetical protein|tara:strand:- start:2908 stop:3561 length:654 start_codon:yes stop_codon:yes gene_type:complete
MSATAPNVPKKGDIIINPNTQRPVKVGSRTWLNLVKQGLVSGHYTDPHQLEEVPEQYREDNKYVEQKIETINKTLPRGKQAVRGRGKYKNKIVSRNTQPSSAEISRYTAQIASRAVNNNIDALVESDDLEGMLEKMIMEEMMATRPATAPPVLPRGGQNYRKKTVGRPKKQEQCDNTKYEVTTQEEEEEEDDEEENDPSDWSGYNDADYVFNENDFE